MKRTLKNFLSAALNILRRHPVSGRILGLGIVLCAATFFLAPPPPSPTAKQKTPRTNASPVEALYAFGSKRNVIIILSSMLQGNLLEQALRKDDAVRKKYAPFMVYSRAISPFPLTGYALPALLGGATYALPDKKPAFAENLSAALADSFVTDAGKMGYDTIAVLGDSSGLPFVSVASKNILLAPSNEGLSQAAKLRFRKMLGQEDASSLSVQKESSLALFREWTKRAHIGKDENRMFFVHSFLTQSPVSYNREGQRLKKTALQRDPREALHEEILFSLDVLSALFEKMKSLGIYDDAMIVIAADHGHPLGHDPVNLDPPKTPANIYPPTMYNPAIMIKPPRAKGGGISHATIGLVDLRAIIRTSLNIGAFNLPQTLSRIRKRNPTLDVVPCPPKSNTNLSEDCLF